MKVVILMATYNGAKYVKEQLQSLRAQSHKDWVLFVRDDGSTDETVALLHLAAKADDRIKIMPADGRRLGASASFAWLLEHSPDSDYYMFCDQDDYWQPEKVELTLQQMQKVEAEEGSQVTPILIHTDLQVGDASLNVVETSFWRFQKLNPHLCDLRHLLLQNNITGCTVMINHSLARRVGNVPENAVMHDWWIGLIAASFGRIAFIEDATIIYRQHGQNDIGAKRYGPRFIMKMALEAKQIRHSLRRTQEQACALLDLFGSDMSPENQALLRVYSGLGRRSFLLRRWQLFRLKLSMNGWARNLGLLLFF